MKLDRLIQLTSDLPCFDMALLSQMFTDRREAIRLQLSRWMKQGKVIGLRRGVYTLSDIYRRAPLVHAALANQLYRPSYLSGVWALGHHDLIPERVVWFTSVTTRVPRRFQNPYGVFDYRHIKQDCFFGFTQIALGGQDVFVAEPEKALLDHWHLTEGEWTTERLDEMRYQHMERVSQNRLREYAGRFQSPRLQRAVERWLALTAEAEKGTVKL